MGWLSCFPRLVVRIGRRGAHYTVGWRAPEQVYSDLRRRAREAGVENRVDLYQIGNLLLYLLTGQVIDGEDSLDEELVEGSLSAVEHGGLRGILAGMLNSDPLKRMGSEEVVKTMLSLYRSLTRKQNRSQDD